MAKGKDTRNDPKRVVTRLRSYGYVGTPSKDLPEGSNLKDDPNLRSVEVGYQTKAGEKGYFPTFLTAPSDRTRTQTMYIDDANKKKTKWGATRQAKKNVKENY